MTLIIRRGSTTTTTTAATGGIVEFDYTANATKASAGLVSGRTYKAETILDSAGAVTATTWTEVETQTRLTAAQVANIDVANDLTPATGGTADTRVPWKAVASTADYNFGDLLTQVGATWSRGDTVLAASPPATDRLPADEYDTIIATAPHVWICRPDGNHSEAILFTDDIIPAANTATVDNGKTYVNTLILESGIPYTLQAGEVLTTDNPLQISVSSRQLLLFDDTTEVPLSAVTGGIPASAQSAYIQVSGYAKMTSVDPNIFPLVREELFGFYIFPTRDVLENIRFRLPTAQEIAVNATATKIGESPYVAWTYTPPVGSLAAAQEQLGFTVGPTTTGRLDGLCLITVTFSNIPQDRFNIISDVSQSFFNSQVTGEQVNTWTTTPIVSIPFQPTMNAVVGEVEMPTVGATVTVTATPETNYTGAAILLADAYPAGDTVILSQIDTNGLQVRRSFFAVTATDDTANTITLQALNVPGAATAGEIFANGFTEITGQTRLPDNPVTGVTALKAEVIVNASEAFTNAVVDQNNSYYRVSNIIASGLLPMVRRGFKGAADIDINFVNRYGQQLLNAGRREIVGTTQIANERMMSGTIRALRPWMEVTYYV